MAAESATQYPLTLMALQERYTDEVIAHQKYSAYAEAALTEGYPAIAHLFQALATSEAVHKENFSRLMRKIGREPAVPSVEFELTSTREHLQQTAIIEAAEIDEEYPDILDWIRVEQHEDALRFVTFAWKAERQHRDLILTIKKAASWYFGMLVSRIEGSPTRYYVCHICGSTVRELPDAHCPICGHPPDQYREVRRFLAEQVGSKAPSGQP